MIMLYIVEDDPNIREIEAYAMRSNGFEVELFTSGDELFLAIAKEIPELVILDIMLPNQDGLSILKSLRSQESTKTIPVIIVSAKASELDKVKGLDLGADDYLTKPFGVMEIVSRVKALLRRSHIQKQTTVLYYQNIKVDDEAHLVFVDDEQVVLTYKEYKLLKYLLQNPGIALTRAQIQEHVWGYDTEIESRTIDIHINTLRKKIKDHNATVIKTVRNVGYKLGG
ncbi:MAG: response regulator transcription factor [Erysipelotrichales bacterium]|nr:response regulator transcription factor [Erysipelotrichales bacterium]